MKNDNQVVTRGILKEEMKGLEKRMDEKLGSSEKRMEKKMDEKNDDLWNRFYEYAASKEDLKKLEERIMGTLDHIVYELENLRTDRDCQILTNERVEDQLVNHEKRIKVLEKV